MRAGGRTRLIGWALVAAACDAKSEDCPAASASPIVLETATGDLDGTLQMPAGCGPFAVVLIHAGSGPTDRNGNNPLLPGTNDSLKLVAAGLAERGVASVRFDKRGVAASHAAELDEEDLRFETFVADAAAWVGKLAADGRFTGVTIAGHSEGSLIGMMAAKQSPAAAFVSIAGLGRPAGEVLREQLGAQLSGELLDEADAILDALEAGVEVEEVPPELYELFRPSVQPYLISYLHYDPSVEAASLAIPAAIIQGTTDIQVSVEDAELLAAAAPDAQLTIIEGMNHVLKAATLEPASQWAAYTDPSLPVVPALFDALVAGVAGAPSRAAIVMPPVR
ncbi:serine aminopeptidase domain-containing protein [Nannocystis radixulma]|uniref:Alpha/beta hydrolase n=1 Tax=Nannocystis radixulma TaxID=2995305 RepID=A0ABT5B606_9BACT|nr:alpha/beta hydrolase [Nannocystis radixulma]MDC0669549.1 alpha/beta hydrolase [Nannocystis radixulma]